VSPRELELKAVVDDPERLGSRLASRGAARTFRGRMTDRRYDLPVRALESRDQVLRVRTFQSTGSDAAPAEVTWKGPTKQSEGYKEREELQFEVGDAAAAHEVLSRLGYVIIEAIDRCVEFYRLGGAVVRIEWYPRMDTLVEVEGLPAEIERAIEATGLSRSAFTPDRLLDFATRYQQRTAERAALSLAALGEDGAPGWPWWAQR
jgi:predicted adenylyl cyclase CyaB